MNSDHCDAIQLWRCATCGYTRSGQHGGRCRNAFSDECTTLPFSMLERIEVVPVEAVRRVLFQHDIDARHILASEAAWDRVKRELLEPHALDEERPDA